MKRPEQCWCPKCGAEPGDACVTIGGNRTTPHKERGGKATRERHLKATNYACWKEGFKAGVVHALSAEDVDELSTSYIAPGAFVEGHDEGVKALEAAVNKARRKFLA